MIYYIYILNYGIKVNNKFSPLVHDQLFDRISKYSNMTDTPQQRGQLLECYNY